MIAVFGYGRAGPTAAAIPEIRPDLWRHHRERRLAAASLFEALEMPGLNHLFQTAATGSPSEYGGIEETIAPAVLEKISSWILKHTAPLR